MLDGDIELLGEFGGEQHDFSSLLPSSSAGVVATM